jgi:spoIIIJ-associated protein
MKEIEVEGKTVEEAIQKALTELKAKQDDVEIKIIDEGKAGLFGLMGGAPARVKVIMKEPEGIKTGAGELALKAREIVTDILTRMEVDGDTCIEQKPENIVISIESLDSALLIGKKGQTLEALQYIVNLMANRMIKAGLVKDVAIEDKYKIVIDTEGYRGRREEALVKLALSRAEKVRLSGSKDVLEPMSAHDRRIVHLALKETPGVRTESEGEGAFRRIVIIPAEK